MYWMPGYKEFEGIKKHDELARKGVRILPIGPKPVCTTRRYRNKSVARTTFKKVGKNRSKIDEASKDR